jgi:leucyl-tRNA synthetase
MSKSKPETCVLPESVSDVYGIDTARFFLCSLASPDKDIDWDENGIQGALRFVNKILGLQKNLKFGTDSKELLKKLNRTIKNISEQIENLDYRKSTIELRELFDLISRQTEVSKETFEKSIKLLAPFCPHIAEELWEKLGNKEFISTTEWPKAEEIQENAKQEDLNEKIIAQLKPLVEKYSDKKNIYLYVMPFEVKQIDAEKISKAVGKMIDVWPVNEPGKYDPEGKAKKAIPGKPAIYLE